VTSLDNSENKSMQGGSGEREKGIIEKKSLQEYASRTPCTRQPPILTLARNAFILQICLTIKHVSAIRILVSKAQKRLKVVEKR
jgi:hypothetical protein